MKAGAAALLFCAAACAQAGKLHIVAADDSAATAQIRADLQKRLGRLQPRTSIYIAIGPAALHQLAAREQDGIVIAAFTSAQVWRSIMLTMPPARASRYTAVYADPAPSDQLRLIAKLYPRPISVAAIFSPDTDFLKNAYQAYVPQNIRLQLDPFAPGADINGALKRIAQLPVLLAVPDRSVINTETIRNLLLSTYRHNQAVIGFSADMVDTGALASTYSSIEDINTQVTEMAESFAASGELPAAQFPRYFRTIVNEGVARSLNVPISEEVKRFARRPLGSQP